jgi:hypothetical protein
MLHPIRRSLARPLFTARLAVIALTSNCAASVPMLHTPRRKGSASAVAIRVVPGIIVRWSRQSGTLSFRNRLQHSHKIDQRPRACAKWLGTRVDLPFQLDPKAGCIDSFVEKSPLAEYRIVRCLGERPPKLIGGR